MKHDFVIDNMIFSFSRLNSYYNCPYGWLMQYIQEMQSEGGFYGEYGSFCHDILEKYGNKELELYELASYYKDKYIENVIHDPPPFPKGLAEKYYSEGLEYFENFDGYNSNWEILEVETESQILTPKGRKIKTIKDLLVRDKIDNKLILCDHKSSDPFKKSKTPDKNKIAEYKRQMYIYSHDIFDKYGEYPKEIWLNFFRIGKWHVIPFDESEKKFAMLWADDTIDILLAEDKWLPKSQKFFCLYLCGMRNYCEYIPQD